MSRNNHEKPGGEQNSWQVIVHTLEDYVHGGELPKAWNYCYETDSDTRMYQADGFYIKISENSRQGVDKLRYEYAGLSAQLKQMHRAADLGSLYKVEPAGLNRAGLVVPSLGEDARDVFDRWHNQNRVPPAPLSATEFAVLSRIILECPIYHGDVEAENLVLRPHGTSIIGGRRACFIDFTPRTRETHEPITGLAEIGAELRLLYDDLPIQLKKEFNQREWKRRLNYETELRG